jgi:hypothetical protein
MGICLMIVPYVVAPLGVVAVSTNIKSISTGSMHRLTGLLHTQPSRRNGIISRSDISHHHSYRSLYGGFFTMQ